MTQKRSMLYSALLLTGVNLLLRLIGTGFQVYLSGLVGAAGIGLLQLVLSVSMLSVTAATAGMRTTSMYLTAQELGRGQPGNMRRVLAGCFRYSLICSTAVCFAVIALSGRIAAQWLGDIRAASAVRLFAAFLPTTCLCGVMTGCFTAQGRIGTLAAVEVAEQLFSMAVTLTALRLGAPGDPAAACCAVVLGGGLGGCLTLACLLVLQWRTRLPAAKPIPITRRLVSTAVPLALADDLKAGISTTENLMVPKRLSLYAGVAEPLAAFGMVCGMVFPVLMFPAAILFALAELLIPELARCRAAGNRERIRYLARRSLRLALLYSLLCAGAEYLLAEPLTAMLYHETAAGAILRRFAPLIPMLYCDAITDALTKGLGEHKACVRYNIITSAMDVALLFVLLPRYGMDGYFLSFALTHAVNFVLSIRRLLRLTGLRVPVRTPVKAVLSACAGVWAGSFCGILRIPVFFLVTGGLFSLFGLLKQNPHDPQSV